jgi:hypothetical protein
MSSVDRMALVSKIMLDQRFLEMKRENERLRLSLFWIDHSINTLKHLTNYANNRVGGPRCRCRCCVRAKRYRPNILDGYDYEDEVGDEACRFGPWLEKIVQAHGLSFAAGGGCVSFEKLDREYHPMPDDDVHLLLFPTDNAPATSWCTWVYGAKLWKAQTTQDAGLLQLSALFRTLTGEDDCAAGGRHDSDSESL